MGKKLDDYIKQYKKEDEKEKKSNSVTTQKNGEKLKAYIENNFTEQPAKETPVKSAPVSTLTPDERRQRTLNIISQTKGALKAGAEAIRPSGGTVTGTGPTKYAQYRREIEALKKSGASGQLIKAKKNEFNQYKTDIYNQKRERRKANLLNKAEKDPDFAAMVEKGKNIYDTVNKEKDRKKFSVSFSPENMSHVGAGDMEDWASRNYKLNNFTDDERNTYLYILGKEGWTAADKYEELISRDINARTAAKETEFLTDWARKNKPAAVALNTASSFLGGAALADTVRQGIRNAGRSDADFVPADNNSGAFIAPRVQAAMTEGITGDIKSPAGKFMAQTGLSTANFLANAAVGGGAVSLGLMGANAGGSGAYEAIERGATPGQAAMLGLVNAAAEIAFERVPVGEFGKLASGDVKKTFARAMIDMAKEEGMEELATEYVNLLGDNIIMGDNSEMQAYIRELMSQGMSADEAKKAALAEFAVKRPALAFLGGAVSGAGIGAAGAGIGRVNMMTDPAVREIVNAVKESQPGLSNARAWGIVMQAMQGNGANAENIPENAENNTANAENVPQEFEAFNETEQEAGGQDWREELISAVMADSGMDRAAAETAVAEAEQNQQTDYEARRARTQEALNEADAQEEAARQADIENAVRQRLDLAYDSEYGKYEDYKDAFKAWVESDISRNGMGTGYNGNYNAYVDDLMTDFQREVAQEYQNAPGRTIETKTRNALDAVLAREGRVNYAPPDVPVPDLTDYSTAPITHDNVSNALESNPERALEYVAENYANNAAGLWGAEQAVDPEYNARKEELGTAAEIAQRNLQEAEYSVRKSFGQTTEREMEYIRALAGEIRNISNEADIREAALKTVEENLEAGRRSFYVGMKDFSLWRNVNVEKVRALLRPYIEHIDAQNAFAPYKGKLKEAAQAQAKWAVDLLEKNGAKDKSMLSYNRETVERNFEDMLKNSPEAAAQINEAYDAKRRHNNGDLNRLVTELTNTVRNLNIDTGRRKLYNMRFFNQAGDLIEDAFNEAGVLQAYGEGLIKDSYLDSLRDNKGRPIDADKIRAAKETMSAIYDKILPSLNGALIDYGFNPALRVKNYFPHFEDEDMGGLEQFLMDMGFGTDRMDLPTGIAGLTEDFSPKKQWFGNILRRTGAKTKYDAIGGFQKYLNTAANILYHTGDVQRYRALEDEIRSRFGTDAMKTHLAKIQESRIRGDINNDEYDAERNEIIRNGRLTKYSNLAQWLHEYTNILAGKQSGFDRGVERAFGRQSIARLSQLTNKFMGNVTGFNVATPITNIIPWFQDDTRTDYKLKGFADTIRTGFKDDGLFEKSDFLASRFSAEPLVLTPDAKFRQKSMWLMNAVDELTAESLIRARYQQNLNSGMNETAAIREADDHVGRVMADRSKGALPVFFEAKNPIYKALTMFQVEVNNQYSYMFKDLPRNKRNKALGILSTGLLRMALAFFLYNELAEKVVNRRPATDIVDMIWTFADDMSGRERNNLLDVALKGEPLYEDKEISPADARANLARSAAGEVPFVGNILGGGRLPVASSVPGLSVINKNLDAIGDSDSARSIIGRELLKPLIYYGAPAGGVQAKKTIEGLTEAIRGGSYVKSRDNEGNDTEILRYPVEQDAPTFIRNALFGKTASEGYAQWKAGGMKNLNQRQTEAYPKIVRANIDNDTYMQFVYNIRKLNTKWEMARAVYDMKGLSTKQKEVLWNNAVRENYSTKGNQPDFTMNRTEFYDTWKKKGDEE